MTVKAWRITRKPYQNSAFSGEGARLYGGRFNSEGFRAVYTSASLSLSLLELLVQIDDPEFINDCVQFYAEIDERLIFKPRINDLPSGWDKIPYGKAAQEFGDKWLKDEQYAVIRIPSVVVPVEFNYVINPGHPEFRSIDISPAEDVMFDPRLR